MDGKDISHEDWREYNFGDGNGPYRAYRIDKPQTLFVGKTTHRVVDAEGVTHCVPVPGAFNCVLTWYTPPERGGPVNF